jgi:hypothetical protein
VREHHGCEHDDPPVEEEHPPLPQRIASSALYAQALTALMQGHRPSTLGGGRQDMLQPWVDGHGRGSTWADKFKRLLLGFERIQQRHYGLKLLAYTLINLRKFCGT